MSITTPKSHLVLSAFNTALGLLVSLLLLSLKMHVERVVDVQLKGYVPKTEFEKYQIEQNESIKEVKKNLEKIQDLLTQQTLNRDIKFDNKFDAVEARLYKLEAQGEATSIRVQAIQSTLRNNYGNPANNRLPHVEDN